MKAVLFCLMLLSFSACSIEKSTIRRTVKHTSKLMEITGKLITDYQHHPNREVFLGVHDSLDRKYQSFLKNTLKTPWVHIIYERAKGFIDTDSVVLFTRTGLPILGTQHNILVDFKTVPRTDFSTCGSCIKVTRIADRVFYLQAPMPAF